MNLLCVCVESSKKFLRESSDANITYYKDNMFRILSNRIT